MKNKMFIKNVKLNDEVKVEYRDRWIRGTVVDITNDIATDEVKHIMEMEIQLKLNLI